MKGKIFIVDTIDNVGKNWLIADFGSDIDGTHYILTTNKVRASEGSLLGTVHEQAKLCCRLLNEHYLGEKDEKVKQLALPLNIGPIRVGTRTCCGLCLPQTQGKTSLIWQPPDYRQGACPLCGQVYDLPHPYGRMTANE